MVLGLGFVLGRAVLRRRWVQRPRRALGTWRARRVLRLVLRHLAAS